VRVSAGFGFGLIALSLALAAGGGTAAGSSDLTGHSWLLKTLSGRPPVPHTSVTMTFSGGKVSGSTGCNSYSGGYTAGVRTLRIQGGQVAATRMACAEAISAQETSFLAMLDKIRRYAVRGDELTLRGTTGKELAKLEVQSQELAGTSWQAIAYNNGKQAVVSVDAKTKLTAVFSKDGNVSGSSGCNTFSATYEANPPKLSFGPFASTRKACASPDVMTQESAYLAALASARTYRIGGETLELRTSTGALAVELSRN
jgi:heat shock protein HslJ